MVPINQTQYLVLQWLSTGIGQPPNEAWKLSARALANRKLVTISRKAGIYTATVTNEGKRYLQNNSPTSSSPKSPRQSSTPKVPAARKSARGKAPTSTTIKRTKKKYHPAVRSLSNHRGALPRDCEAQQRAIDAADALVKAIIAAGFKLEGYEQPTKSPITNRDPFTGCPLVTIKTEHLELVVTVGEQLKRIPHELTAKEKADNANKTWFWERSYDYIRTGKTFFRIKNSYDTKKYLETDRKPLVEYVPRLLSYVTEMETQAQEREEAAKRAAIERAEREEQARILSSRRKAYDVWEKELVSGFDDWDRLQRLRQFIDTLAAVNDSENAQSFIKWSRDYADALDPVKNFQPPASELPDLSHQERARYGEFKEQASRYGYGW